MENLFVYLAKASGLLTLFFLAYYLFIKKETFFNSGRFFLITGIITSVLLPFFAYTKIVWIDAAPQQVFILNPAEIKDSVDAIAVVQQDVFEINWWYIAVVIYAIGVLFFIIKLAADLYRISGLLKGQSKKYTEGYILVDSAFVSSPFSFFKYIVYNSTSLTPNELENIIAHEKVHSRQWHSADMILNQIICAVLWFNPVSWMYKKQASQNLEFIADAEAAKSIADIKEYQKTMLKITLSPESIAVTNHFYQSLIKKRIIMLNKPQSQRLNLIKFAFILPAVAAFFYFFQTDVIAQVREDSNVQKQSSGEPAPDLNKVADRDEIKYPILEITHIDKNLSDKTIKERKAEYQKIFQANVIFKNLKRNKKGEITAITVIVKDKNNIEKYPVYESISTDGSPIQAFTLNIEKAGKDSDNKIYFQKSGQNDTPLSTTATSTKQEMTNDILGPVEYVNSRTKNRDVIVVINDEIQQSKTVEAKSGEKFESIIELDAKSTLKRYKIKTKDGAIVLTTKKTENTTAGSTEKNNVQEKTKRRFEAIGANLNENVWQNNGNSNIRTVTVTTMTDKNGEVIHYNDEHDIYFVVNKNTTDIQLNTFKQDLVKAGIQMTYSDVKRNSKGAIVFINIKVKDNTNDSKSYTTSDPHKNESGIPNIYIGRIKGLLAVSASK